jgi:GH15 family glucan-1,4-alpha-glucosidase
MGIDRQRLEDAPTSARHQFADSPRRAGGMDPDKEAEPTPFLERRMPSSPFPAIADYAFLSDCHTGALVAPDGTVEWLCPPRFDSPSVFAAVLDRSAGGWRFGPTNMGKPVGRRYEPGTNIVETTWMTPTGWMIVRDALIVGRWRQRESTKASAHTRPPSDYDAHHVLVRTARCVHGSVQLEQVCEPVFGYGKRPAEG